MLTYLDRFNKASLKLFQTLPPLDKKFVCACLLLPWSESNTKNFMGSVFAALKEEIREIPNQADRDHALSSLKNVWSEILHHWILRFNEITDGSLALFESQESCLVFKVAVFNSILHFYAIHYATGELPLAVEEGIATVYACITEEIQSLTWQEAEGLKYGINYSIVEPLNGETIERITHLFNAPIPTLSSSLASDTTTLLFNNFVGIGKTFYKIALGEPINIPIKTQIPVMAYLPELPNTPAIIQIKWPTCFKKLQEALQKPPVVSSYSPATNFPP